MSRSCMVNATPPRLGQYYAGRSASCGRVILIHYVEPKVEIISLTPEHKATLSLTGIAGLYKNGDFFVGYKELSVNHVSLQADTLYFQGAVGDTCDEAIQKLAQMCVIPGLSVMS